MGRAAPLLLQRAGVQPGLQVLDAGCGPGRLTLPVAERVGADGHVTALDLQAGMLAKLRGRLAERGIGNVALVQAGLGSGALPATQFDVAFLVTVLGEIPDQFAALREIRAALRPGGVLSITEVLPDPHYQSIARVRQLASQTGFREQQLFPGWVSFTINLERPAGEAERQSPLSSGRGGHAQAGIAWLAVSYRLAPKVTYPAPVEDVLTAIRWTRRNARRLRLEPQRLAVVGESAGGHLVAGAAVRMTDDTRIAAVVPFFAPVDLESDSDRRGGMSRSMRTVFGRSELDEASRQLLRDASPIRRVQPGLPPFLLVHGTADMSVPYEQSVRMQRTLREKGVACDLITVPDGTHGTRDWDGRLPGFADQVVAWLVEKIGR